MRVFVFLFIILIGGGCRTTPNETDKNISVYKVDLDKAKEISTSEIFSHIDIIPLKTPDTVVCSGIRSTVYKDNIFFLDWRQKIILCFDLNGNFRYQINSKGRGPKEYSDILAISTDQYNDYLMVLDRQSMLQFDLSGNFIKKIKYPEGLVVHSAKMINQDTMFCITVTNNKPERKIINYLSLKDNKIIASCYSEDPIFPVTEDAFDYNNKSYYAISKAPFVYSVNKLKLIPEYKWDFGKYNYDYNDLTPPVFKNKKDLLKNQQRWLYKNCPWLIGMIAENYHYKYARIIFPSNTDYLKEQIPTYHIFWNKKTENYKIVPRFKEGDVFHIFSSWTDHAVYCAIEKSMLPQFIDIKALTPENQKIIKELPEDCNPIVLKYVFKKDE